LTQYDEWGQRVDRLYTSEGWRALEAFAVREGYVATAFEKKYHEHSRTVMFARNIIMTGDSNVVGILLPNSCSMNHVSLPDHVSYGND
jgi:hypothetical protein